MDKEIHLEISKIISLANVDAGSILPNLFSTGSSTPQSISPQPIVKEEPSEEDTQEPLEKKLKSGDQFSTGPSTPQSSSSQPIIKKEPSKENTQQPHQKKLKPVYTPLPKKNRKYLGMKAHEVRFHMQGDKVIEFCQQYGLIAKQVICSCGKSMQLAPRDVSDGWHWLCRHPQKLKASQTLRKGTWFEKSRLSLADILWIAYMWVYEYSYVSMIHECDQSTGTVIEWCSCCVDLCQVILEFKSNPLGGEGISVEIYECKFKKNPNQRSTNPGRERWVLCGIEQYSTNSLLIIVEDKESDTVLQMLDKYFLPGTTLISQTWSALKKVTVEDFRYLTKEKLISFLDLSTKKKMDHFDDFKEVVSRPPPGLNKWSKLEYGPRFFEKMYRKCLAYAPDAYLEFLKDIALVYKPCENLVTGFSKEIDG